MDLRTLFSSAHVSKVDAAGEHAQHFSTLCHRLMTEVELHVFDYKKLGETPVARFRLAELEYYWQSRKHHADFFTHCDEMQKKGGRWYLHRQGAGYRSGSFKGIDLACGNSDAFGGLLVRGVRRVGEADNKKAYIDGPSLCVDAFLAASGTNDVKTLGTALDSEQDGSFFDSRFMRLVTVDAHPPSDPSVVAILAAPRVGLSLKSSSGGQKHNDTADASGDDATPSRWLMRRYRYVAVFGTSIKDGRILTGKGRPLLVSAGLDHAEAELGGKQNFMRIVNTPQSRMSALEGLRNVGKKQGEKDIAGYENRALKDDELVSLYGLLEALGKVGEHPRSMSVSTGASKQGATGGLSGWAKRSDAGSGVGEEGAGGKRRVPSDDTEDPANGPDQEEATGTQQSKKAKKKK